MPARALRQLVCAASCALPVLAADAAQAQKPAKTQAAVAAQAPAGRDSVSVRNRKSGALSTITGRVESNGLAELALVVDGKSQTLDQALVERLTLGDLPESFRRARAAERRGDFSEAGASFRLVAGDAQARAVVRAAARLAAAECLLRAGAGDPARFSDALDDARRFQTEWSADRGLARARMVEARALRLAGRPAEAAKVYADVFGAGKSAAPGYELELSLGAGVAGVRALLDAGDTLAARELAGALASAADAALARAERDESARVRLAAVAGEARLTEGFADLASGNQRAALAFFQSRVLGADASAAERAAVWTGLGECYFADGRFREARIEFARVAALDWTDRDRTARALVRLAECAQKLDDPESKAQAAQWLADAAANYGDTTWAGKARELARKS